MNGNLLYVIAFSVWALSTLVACFAKHAKYPALVMFVSGMLGGMALWMAFTAGKIVEAGQ